jgi:uncharacterized protein
MAQTTPELKLIVQSYRAQVERMGIRVDQVLLFGSQAAGAALDGSDIDLIVLSDDWEKYNHRERLELLGIAAARIMEPVQAQGFTQAEISQHRLLPFWELIIQEQAITI